MGFALHEIYTITKATVTSWALLVVHAVVSLCGVSWHIQDLIMVKSLSVLRKMQRNQRNHKAVTKDELIDSILSSQEEAALQTVTTKLDMIMNDMADLKKTIAS